MLTFCGLVSLVFRSISQVRVLQNSVLGYFTSVCKSDDGIMRSQYFSEKRDTRKNPAIA
ncbi:hypothetical protein [Nostoc sp.]|uniref:hypothetical protein n=1 Tax=Nostoc sp. TaxID=1180 RepID=UPI002FFCBDB7